MKEPYPLEERLTTYMSSPSSPASECIKDVLPLKVRLISKRYEIAAKVRTFQALRVTSSLVEMEYLKVRKNRGKPKKESRILTSLGIPIYMFENKCQRK
jgi:hypothetical protein